MERIEKLLHIGKRMGYVRDITRKLRNILFKVWMLDLLLHIIFSIFSLETANTNYFWAIMLIISAGVHLLFKGIIMVYASKVQKIIKEYLQIVTSKVLQEYNSSAKITEVSNHYGPVGEDYGIFFDSEITTQIRDAIIKSVNEFEQKLSEIFERRVLVYVN